jgi:hypothetical protein
MEANPSKITYDQLNNIFHRIWYKTYDLASSSSLEKKDINIKLEDGCVVHRDDDLPAVIEYLTNGIIYKMIWYKEGRIHRDNDKYAMVHLFNDVATMETWYKEGMTHRDNDLPAEITYYGNKNILSQTWYQNGKRHREGDNPANIVFNLNGIINAQEWRINDLYHRENDKPAHILYYISTGNIWFEKWYHYGKTHRAGDKPSCIVYYNSINKIRSLSWTKEDKPFRTKGNHHYIEYRENGSIFTKSYFKDGNNIDFIYNTDGTLRDSIRIRDL